MKRVVRCIFYLVAVSILLSITIPVGDFLVWEGWNPFLAYTLWPLLFIGTFLIMLLGRWAFEVESNEAN